MYIFMCVCVCVCVCVCTGSRSDDAQSSAWRHNKRGTYCHIIIQKDTLYHHTMCRMIRHYNRTNLASSTSQAQVLKCHCIVTVWGMC